MCNAIFLRSHIAVTNWFRSQLRTILLNKQPKFAITSSHSVNMMEFSNSKQVFYGYWNAASDNVYSDKNHMYFF